MSSGASRAEARAASLRTPENSPDAVDQMLDRSRSSVARTPRSKVTDG